MTQLTRTRRLARAFRRLEADEARVAASKLAFDREFNPWAAGRSINRDEARVHLVSTGFLEKRNG